MNPGRGDRLGRDGIPLQSQRSRVCAGRQGSSAKPRPAHSLKTDCLLDSHYVLPDAALCVDSARQRSGRRVEPSVSSAAVEDQSRKPEPLDSGLSRARKFPLWPSGAGWTVPGACRRVDSDCDRARSSAFALPLPQRSPHAGTVHSDGYSGIPFTLKTRLERPRPAPGVSMTTGARVKV